MEDYREKIGGLASKILDEELMKKVGQLGAFAGVGYGGYKLANSSVGMSTGSAASSTIGNISQDVGFTFNEMSASQDYDGRAYRPSQRSYDLSQQAMNEASAGLFGTGIGAGSTAAMLGGGYVLSQTGLAAGISGVASGLGGAAGTAIGQGAFGLAGGVMNAGLSAFGMGGAGSLAAKGMAYAGQGAGHALGFAGAGLGTLAMPLAGAWAAGKVADTFSDQLAYQRQAETAIQEESHRFTPGMATNALTGRGLSYRDSAELATTARESLSENLYMRQGDLDEVLEGMSEGDLMYNVRGAEEFQNKFEKVTETLRDVSRIYETTLKESAELLGEMQRSGFYTTADQTQMLLQSDAIGRMTGYTGSEVVQMGTQGARTARQYGLGRRLGYETSTMMNWAIEENVQGIDSASSQEYLENIQEVGGKEEATAGASRFMLGLTQDKRFQSALFGVLNEEGEIDEDALQGVLSGDTSYIEMQQNTANLLGKSPEMRAEYQTNAANYFEKLEGPEFLQFMSKTIESFNEQAGLGRQGWDIENTLKMLGLEDQKLRKIIEGAIKSSGVIDENALMRRTVEQQLREDRLEKRSLSGVIERISNFMAETGRNLVEESGVVDAYTDFRGRLEEGYNRIVGGVETVGEWDYSEVDFGADVSEGNIVSMFENSVEGTGWDRTSDHHSFYGKWRYRQNKDFNDYEELLQAGAEASLGELTGNAGTRYKTDEINEVFTDDYVNLSTKYLGHGLTEDALNEGTVRIRDVDWDLNKIIEEEGYTEEQQKIFSDVLGEMQTEYRNNLTDDMSDEQRLELRQDIYRKYQGGLSRVGRMGDKVHTLRAQEIFKGKLPGLEGYLAATDNEDVADVFASIRNSGGSITENVTKLFDGLTATNGVTDERLIKSLGDENQKEILSLGLDYNSGQLSREEIMAELEDNALFRDQDLAGLSKLENNQFNTALNNMLSEEFMSTFVADTESTFSMTNRDEQAEYWEEVLKSQIRETGQAIADGLKENAEATEGLNKNIDVLENIKNDNLGNINLMNYSP
jgi:hypothetical protein